VTSYKKEMITMS